MDAMRIARGLTGRDTILKIFGSYHGHHDAVMVVVGDVDTTVDPEDIPSTSYGGGIPQAMADLTVAVPLQPRLRARTTHRAPARRELSRPA